MASLYDVIHYTAISYAQIQNTSTFWSVVQPPILNVLYKCGGHHDSDRMAVLVMVSQAEIIVL